MLIEFSVTNWRSLRDKQTLSLVAGKGDELPGNTATPAALSCPRLLTSAAIYGANASGKSNFLEAMRFARQLILSSASQGQQGEELEIKPFLLDEENAGAPCEFEFSFIADNVRYQYGFSANKDRVLEEWLFAYPKGRPQRWLGRAWDGQEYQWQNCSALSGNKQVWQAATRENALFLSTAVQLNAKALHPVFNWFKHKLRIATSGGWHDHFTIALCKDDAQRNKVLEFLRAADLDIEALDVRAEKFSKEHLPNEIGEEMRERLFNQMKDGELLEIKTLHRNAQGNLVKFDLDEDESSGTKKFFSLCGPWLNSLEEGYTLCIDELNQKLHPKLLQFLLQLFHDPEHNPRHAQLIFTTHETSILSQEVFRRDQIWFCEKNPQQATHLFPLTDFHPRKGREDLEAGYLSGRYGALPYLRPLRKAANLAG